MGEGKVVNHVSLQVLQHQVASAALTGRGFEEIDESVITASGCSDAQREALRLYALSFLSRFELRRMALDRLFEVGLSEDDDGPPLPAGLGSAHRTEGDVGAPNWLA